MKRTKTQLKIRGSYWFLPALYGIVGFLLAISAIWLDLSFSKETLKNAVPDVLITNTKLAVTLLSTMVQSILTMMTISFSTIMVVLTTFSGQFSPRTLQNFISDRMTQGVLAVYSGGVVYNLVTLLVMKPSSKGSLFLVPLISVAIGILCVAAFVYFINHVAKWVQVNNLIDKLTKEAIETIRNKEDEIGDSQYEGLEHHLDTEGDEHLITSKRAGYVELLDFQTLIRKAEKDRTIVQLHVYIGDYVMRDTALLSCWYTSGKVAVEESDYRSCVKLGTERTGVQDIEFGIQKLVEIALRAISPAINDPHTAINCINRIGTILVELGKVRPGHLYLYDQEGRSRVVLKQHDFSYYLYKGFYQIRHYGKEDVSVTTAILHVLKLIAEAAPPDIQEIVYDYANYIFEGFEHDVLLSKDKEYIEREWNELINN